MEGAFFGFFPRHQNCNCILGNSRWLPAHTRNPQEAVRGKAEKQSSRSLDRQKLGKPCASVSCGSPGSVWNFLVLAGRQWATGRMNLKHRCWAPKSSECADRSLQWTKSRPEGPVVRSAGRRTPAHLGRSASLARAAFNCSLVVQHLLCTLGVRTGMQFMNKNCKILKKVEMLVRSGLAKRA
ncbi:EEF1A lysine methyltransferase 2 isoform X3 [Varanus komodoensis]|uniref:EEF1A lysine methyltransferase 2 isoform X3 n=1 Tax=Varanus komodoensis TaxID=61221 RepID=UPI001CF76F01|nr:EEF1A lysine methyltransferase 2 isoform X3 [Varanus komodoensis]